MGKNFIGLIFLLILFSKPSWADAPRDIYVDDDWALLATGVDPDGTGPATQMGIDAFSSISPAVTAVESGGTIHIAEGSFSEQVEIVQDLTLIGRGSGTRITSPASLPLSFNTGVDNKPLIWVHDSGNVRIENLVVDGLGRGNVNYRFIGIAYQNAGGTIDHVEVRAIRNTPVDGSQHGIGIYIRNLSPNDHAIFLNHNEIHDYQKNGIAVVGDHLTATITDNVVTGAGDTPLIAQNGIQLSYGAVGSIRRNTVRGNSCSSPTGHCTDDPTSSSDYTNASGILIFAPGNALIDVGDNILDGNQCQVCALSSTAFFGGATALNVSVHGNTVTSGQLGVGIFELDGSVPFSFDIVENDISGGQYGLFVNDSTPTETLPAVEAHRNRLTGHTIRGAWSNVPVNAQGNWWGCPEGSQLTPGPCDSHTSLVDVGNWLTTSDISSSGGISGAGGNAGSSGGSDGASGESGNSGAGGSAGVTGEPSGETAGISGNTTGSAGLGGFSSTGGSSGQGGDIGDLTGAGEISESAGCSCRLVTSL